MPSWLLLLALLVLVAVVVVGFGARSEGAASRRRARDDRDDETLAEAENEVQQLDARVSPDDADDHLPDWGPGAPKPP